MNDVVNYAVICRAVGQMDSSSRAQMDFLRYFGGMDADTTG